MSIDISNIGLGEAVFAEELGAGKVVEVTEKPSIRVHFSKAGLRWLTQESAEKLNVKYIG